MVEAQLRQVGVYDKALVGCPTCECLEQRIQVAEVLVVAEARRVNVVFDHVLHGCSSSICEWRSIAPELGGTRQWPGGWDSCCAEESNIRAPVSYMANLPRRTA